jgi:hypothetical protein
VMKEIYSKDYFDHLDSASYRSACFYVDKIVHLFRPESALDFGCGNGSWLRACAGYGIPSLRGIDGPWNDGESLRALGIEFTQLDFSKLDENSLPSSPIRADMAICVEVAEHLYEKHSDLLIDYLTSSSDVIIFSSAFENQGGEHHVNENLHSYWAQKFKERGFAIFDLFRQEFWNNQEIGFWYRQNCFLYVKEGSTVINLLEASGKNQLERFAFMDCVHPELLRVKCAEGLSFEETLKNIVPSLVRSIRRRGGRLKRRWGKI